MVTYTPPVKLICYLNITRKGNSNNKEIAALIIPNLPLWKSIAYPWFVTVPYSAKLNCFQLQITMNSICCISYI